MSIKDNISTLGIPKYHYCPNCGHRENLDVMARKNLADCMIANGAGLWALLHCERCGYADRLYPAKINGIDCTQEECDALIKEIRRWDERKNSI